jgi:hypothetical protein
MEPAGTFSTVRSKFQQLFITLVDAVFTSVLEPRFTKILIEPRRHQRALACDAFASRINSLATLIGYQRH